MYTLEPRVQVGPFLTAPDAGERPTLWVLFDTDGSIRGVWRSLEAAERDLRGIPYTVHLAESLTRGPVPVHPFARILSYLMGRITTPIR